MEVWVCLNPGTALAHSPQDSNVGSEVPALHGSWQLAGVEAVVMLYSGARIHFCVGKECEGGIRRYLGLVK